MKRDQKGQFLKRKINKEWLYQKFVIEKLPWKEFYEKHNISPFLLSSRLKEYGINRPRTSWNKGTKRATKPNKTSFKKGGIKPKNAFSFTKGYKQSEEHKKNLKVGIINSYKNGRMPARGNLGKQHSLETKIKISKNRKGKCVGENHFNWKGGVSPEEMKIRTNLEYKIWKLEVYKRDRGICRICGKRCNNKNIVAHHLKLFSEYSELRFSADNGITLCRSCHLRLHNSQNYKKDGTNHHGVGNTNFS